MKNIFSKILRTLITILCVCILGSVGSYEQSNISGLQMIVQVLIFILLALVSGKLYVRIVRK